MILRFLVMSVAVWIISMIVPGVKIKGIKAAMVVSLIYGALNFLLFRVLLFVTFPLVLLKYLTLGLFGIILNAVLLMITDKLMDDFELSGFGSALLAAVGISLVNLVLGWVVL